MKTQLDFFKVYHWGNVTKYSHPYHILKLRGDGSRITERFFNRMQYLSFLHFVPEMDIQKISNELLDTDYEVCYTAKKGKLGDK